MLTQNWGMVATPLRSPVMWPQLYLQLGDGAPEGVRKSGLGRVLLTRRLFILSDSWPIQIMKM